MPSGRIPTTVFIARRKPLSVCRRTSPPLCARVDASTGVLRWKRHVEDHPVAHVTGTPKLHAGRLYVAGSSVEEVVGADPKYQCCTFRGSVLATRARTKGLVVTRSIACAGQLPPIDVSSCFTGG